MEAERPQRRVVESRRTSHVFDPDARVIDHRYLLAFAHHGSLLERHIHPSATKAVGSAGELLALGWYFPGPPYSRGVYAFAG
jgi:hypothetical protein